MKLGPTLAVDYGTKRIGVAISRASLAEPLVILDNNDSVFERLQQICVEEAVEQVIVGISENEMAEKTKEFVNQLQTTLRLPMELVDETLSSHTVHRKLIEGSMKQSRRQEPVDHYAAAEFLQEWLDSRS